MAKLNIDLTLNPNDFQKGLTATEKKVLDFSNSLGKDFDKAGENAGKGFAGGFKDAFEKAKDSFDLGSVLNLAGGLTVANLATQGISALANGIKDFGQAIWDGYERADTALTNLTLGFQNAGLSGEALSNQIAETNDFANKASIQYGISATRLKEISANTATVIGLTGKLNNEFSLATAGIEQFTNGQVNAEKFTRLFTRTLNDPENTATLRQLQERFPEVANAIAEGGTQAEITARITEKLAGQFKTLDDDASDLNGTLAKFGQTASIAAEEFGMAFFGSFDLSEAFGGLNINELLADIIEVAKELGRVLSEQLIRAFKLLQGIFDSVVTAIQPLTDLFNELFEQLGDGNSILTIFYDTLKIIQVIIDTVLISSLKLLANIISALLTTIINLGKAFFNLINNLGIVKFFKSIYNVVIDLVKSLGPLIEKLLSLLGIDFNVTEIEVKATADVQEIEQANNALGKTDEKTKQIGKSAKVAKQDFTDLFKEISNFSKASAILLSVDVSVEKRESDKIISDLRRQIEDLDFDATIDASSRINKRLQIEQQIIDEEFRLKELARQRNAEAEIKSLDERLLKEQDKIKKAFTKDGRIVNQQLFNKALSELDLKGNEEREALALKAGEALVQIEFEKNQRVLAVNRKAQQELTLATRKSFEEQQKLFDSILNEKFNLDYDLNFDLTGFLNKSNQLKSQNKDNQRDFEQTNRNLRQQLDKGEISYNEFANQLEIANEKIVNNTESTFSRIADSIANAFSRIKSSIDIGVNAFDKYNEIQVRTGERERELRAILESSSADLLQRNNAQIEINKILAESENAKYAVFADVAGQMASLFSEQTIAYKAFAIAQASIATYLAATQALANPSLFPPLNVISASLIAALGLANVAKIAGFKDGGFSAKVNPNKEAEIFQSHGGEYIASNKVLRQDKIGFFKMLDKTRNLESALLFASDKLNVNSRPVQVINAGFERTKEQKVIVKLDNRQSFEHSIKSKIKGKDLEVLANKAKRAKLSRF